MREHSQPRSELLQYVEAIYRAVERREAMRVVWLLGDALAIHLPREVFEEALTLSRAPRDSLRAPMHLLRYYHRTAQLLAGGEPDHSADQLAFDFARTGG